jgi:hypothetical protein
MGKNQHVVPHEKGWAVKGAGNKKATSIHNTQEEARKAAREIAINQQSEVVIHRPNEMKSDFQLYPSDDTQNYISLNIAFQIDQSCLLLDHPGPHSRPVSAFK